MNMPLDARQRAMLQEMGVRLWGPTQSAAAVDLQPTIPKSNRLLERPTPPALVQAVARPQQAPIAAAPGPTAAPLGWVLHPPRALYPEADPQQTPQPLGSAWLIVAEGTEDGDPFAGDPGRLLGNMLQALQLHRHPRVFLCALSAQAGTDTHPADAALAQAMASIQPSVLLLMGRAAARAVLQRSEPLGQLRGQTHRVTDVPAVVTYDAPYLLRAPHAKPAAWADLCLARALACSTSAPS